jgi:hypothetical protein
MSRIPSLADQRRGAWHMQTTASSKSAGAEMAGRSASRTGVVRLRLVDQARGGYPI